MRRTGRKPLGPALVRQLAGSDGAKVQLEVMLESIAGRLTIAQACARLGIGQARFFRLRSQVLEAGLKSLEPRPLGRPPRARAEPDHVHELQQQVDELEAELQLARLREEIAHVMPQLVQEKNKKRATPTPIPPPLPRRRRRKQYRSMP